MTNPTICVRTSGERYALLFLDERPTDFFNHESPVAVTALVWDAAGKDWSEHPILAPGVDAIRPRCWGNDLRHIAAIAATRYAGVSPCETLKVLEEQDD